MPYSTSCNPPVGADVPYIIDASYARQRTSSRASSTASSSSSASSLSRSNTIDSLYVNVQGRIHEPSYRMFPAPASSAMLRQSSDDNISLSSVTQSRLATQRRRHRAFAQQRPGILRDLMDEDEDEDLTDILDDRPSSSSSRAMFVGAHYPTQSYRPATPVSSSRLPPSPLPSWAPPTHSQLPDYSPPDPQSPFATQFHESVRDLDDDEAAPKARSWLRKSPSFEEPSDNLDSSQTSALRRHWEMLSLRVQFGAHRTKQKLQTRLHSALPPSVMSF